MAARAFVAGLLCAALAACGGAGQGERSGVITMGPHLTETVFALNQGHRLIAVGKFDDFPLEALHLPKVGGYLDPDLEQITRLSPELIILPGRHQKVADYARIYDLPVLQAHMDSIETIDAGIAAIGEALGAERAAAALRESIRAELARLGALTAGLERPRVFIVTSRQPGDLTRLHTVGGASFVSEVVELAGGENIFGDRDQAYFEAPKESVVAAAPEVILEFHAEGNLTDRQTQAFVNDWRNLPSLPAVQLGRIFVIDDTHALRPGPRVAQVVALIMRRLHPQVDPTG